MPAAVGRDLAGHGGLKPDLTSARVAAWYFSPMDFQETVELVGQVIDAVGVAAIVIGTVAATALAGWRVMRGRACTGDAALGRSILSAWNRWSRPTSSHRGRHPDAQRHRGPRRSWYPTSQPVVELEISDAPWQKEQGLENEKENESSIRFALSP